MGRIVRSLLIMALIAVVGNEGDLVTDNNNATATTTVKRRASVPLRRRAGPARARQR